MARSNVGETVQRIRRQLASSYRYEVSTLSAGLTADVGATTVALSILAPSVIEGAVLSIGGEDMRVLTVDRVARTVTVLRAWMDSALEIHAAGAEVAVNARFPGHAIIDAIKDEITSWGPDLFRVKGAPVSVAGEALSFELGSEFAGAYYVLGARRNITDDATTVWPDLEVKVQTAPIGEWSAALTTGMHVRIVEPSTSGSTVFVLVAVPFDAWDITAASDLVADVGIEPSMLELVDLGVKMRLMYDAENNLSARSAQDDPRRNEETPPGSAIGVARSIRALYIRRRSEEMFKLRGRYPIRMS